MCITWVGEAHPLFRVAIATRIVEAVGRSERSERFRQRQAHRGDTKKRAAPKRRDKYTAT